jgi:prenylcysteine oxidase/farnesylcysteine lyase
VNTIDAFTAYVSLAGVDDGSLWSVVGGNWKIPSKVLEASGATLHEDEVTAITRISESNGKVQYKITTEAGGDAPGNFDVVVVANPLNTSKTKFENFPMDPYTPASTTPYHRTVAEFIQGQINTEFFGVSGNDRNFPTTILTAGMEGAPFPFCSVAVEIPSEITQDQVRDYTKPITEEPIRVWKVFVPEPMTEEEKEAMFSEIKDRKTFDWLAYPEYKPPEEFPPFILDDGVFYINAIEKAASAMEMSAIGAKNAALLAREYLLKSSD